MGQDSIDKVLAERKIAAQPTAEPEGDTFFSIMVGDGDEEKYLELKMRDGLRICLSYTDLAWFSYDPEGPKIDLEFGGIFATIKGRGLGGKLFDGLRRKRVAWIQEADTDMQDHPKNAVFIEGITFQTPKEEDAATE